MEGKCLYAFGPAKPVKEIVCCMLNASVHHVLTHNSLMEVLLLIAVPEKQPQLYLGTHCPVMLPGGIHFLLYLFTCSLMLTIACDVVYRAHRRSRQMSRNGWT